MTASNPEQMRALADMTEHMTPVGYARHDAAMRAALRAAADQLEAVQRTIEDYDEDDVDGRGLSNALEAILTADTAPQEDRDE